MMPVGEPSQNNSDPNDEETPKVRVCTHAELSNLLSRNIIPGRKDKEGRELDPGKYVDFIFFSSQF